MPLQPHVCVADALTLRVQAQPQICAEFNDVALTSPTAEESHPDAARSHQSATALQAQPASGVLAAGQRPHSNDRARRHAPPLTPFSHQHPPACDWPAT